MTPNCPAGKLCGTAQGYSAHRCRCPGALEVERLYRKRIRVGLHQPAWVDATGTNRRIQALLALGWPIKTIAAELGYASPRSHPYKLVKTPTGRVHRTMAVKVAKLYDRLSMTIGPSARTASRAARAGYLVPLVWDDEQLDDPKAKPVRCRSRVVSSIDPATIDQVLIERALAGDAPRRLRPAEIREAVRRAVTAPMWLSDAATAQLLQRSDRQVLRIRQTLGLPAAQFKEEALAWA